MASLQSEEGGIMKFFGSSLNIRRCAQKPKSKEFLINVIVTHWK